MNQGHILLVEDDPAIAAALRSALSAAGHSVTLGRNGAEALAQSLVGDNDLLLLDLGLPDMDGKDVIRAVRERSATPIIVISARHQESEKIASLDCGADDYVDKPFALGELLARVRAAIRKRARAADRPQRFECGALTIDFADRSVRLAGEALHLSPKEYNLLAMLAENAGQVVTHRRLLAAGWGRADTDQQYLRTYMGMLRQKLAAGGAPGELIQNEPGIGYRLAAPE